MTIEEIQSDAYKSGWKAWEFHAKSDFKITPSNPYPEQSNDARLWNNGWNRNFFGICDEEIHLKEFENEFTAELEIYHRRGGEKIPDLETFYWECRNGAVKRDLLEGLKELIDVHDRLAVDYPITSTQDGSFDF